jgi:predicted nucleotidyltransferase
MEPKIPLNHEKITRFCRKWSVVEFSLFGSVLTEEFRADSDVDVMVAFAEDAKWTIIDLAKMERELSSLFGREVDLLTRPGVEMMENYIRRKSILRGSKVVYAA